MDYEQKYKEALDRARYYHSKNYLLINCSSAIENIFPELKESEDEKIKKTLIEYIKGIKSWNYFLGISKEQMITWLEKQGEQNTLDADKIIEWLKNNGWCTVCRAKIEMAQINKFKKDFGL